MTDPIVNPPELVSHVVNSAGMAWQETGFEKSMKVLYRDDQGRSTIMVKMEPGAIVPLHEHTALEQT